MSDTEFSAGDGVVHAGIRTEAVGGNAEGPDAGNVGSETGPGRGESGISNDPAGGAPRGASLSVAELERLAELGRDLDDPSYSVYIPEVGRALRRALAELAELRGRVGGWQPPSHWKVVSGLTHEDWIASRRDYLTASDLASVLGKGYKTREQVVRAKAFPGPEDKGNRRMMMGQFLEDGVAAAFGHFTGRKVVRVRSAAGASVLVAHPTIPGIAASLDAVVLGPDGLPTDAVEIKCTSGYVRKYNYTAARIQLQCQMAVTGLGMGHVVACAGTDIDWQENIPASESFQAKLPFWVADFWRDVERLRARGPA